MPEEKETVDPSGDFEINDQGLYVATQQFLLKRGYCCGNACQNCPYPLTHYKNGKPKPKCRQIRPPKQVNLEEMG